MTPTELLATPAEDAQIVSAVRNGDLERYRELVQRHERLVFAVAWSRLGDAALAEEAAQEAFIRGYRRLWLLRDGAKFSGWIAAVTRRVALNLGIRHRRELNKRARWALEQPPHYGYSADESTETATPEMLRQGLAELPAAHRECLVLYYLEGKSGAEAAAQLGISEIAFRARLHRARAALREQLEEKLETSLQELRPAASLAPAVMAAIWASSAGKASAAAGGAVATGVGVKMLSVLGKFVIFSWFLQLIPAITMLPTLTVSWGLRRLELRNFREAQGFRARQHRQLTRNFLWIFPLMLLGFVVMRFCQPGIGSVKAMFLASGGIMLLLAPFQVRLLTIQRNPFQIGMFAASLVMAGCLCALGLGFIPTTLLMLPATVFILSFAILAKYRPMRMDYNLHLRAAQGLLPPVSEDVPCGLANRFDRRSLLRFAAFLGSRYLAFDYLWDSRGLLLALPPAGRQLVVPLFASRKIDQRRSRLLLEWDGCVSSHCGEKDAAAISAMPAADHLEVLELETLVAGSVARAWREFRNGNYAAAEKSLGQVPESEIFVKPPGRALATRLLQWFMVLTISPAIVLLAAHFVWPAFLTGLKPVNLTEVQVRAFLTAIPSNTMTGPQPANSAWTALSRPQSFVVLPPTNLFTADALRTLKESLRHFYGASDSTALGQTAGNPLRPFINPWFVSRAIEGGWISWEDLGATPEEVSVYAHRPGIVLPLVFRTDNMFVNEDSRSWGDDDLFTVQRLSEFTPDMLRLLRDVKCLDLLPRDQLIEQISSVQVLSGTVLSGQPPVHDWREVRGLFFTPSWPALHDTYYSLAALEMLGGLDKIDRQACIDGILRLHHGKGYFGSSDPSSYNEYHVMGDANDTFCAFESLRILGGLDRVNDLDEWKFRPDHRGYKSLPNWNDIEAWLCQQRLAKILAKRKANPHAPVRSLRDP